MILIVVFLYVRYAVSYHDLEEIMQERGIGNDGIPEMVVIDKNGANQAGLLNLTLFLWGLGWWPLIEILQVKYLNNIVEQDHRFIKKIIRPIKGVKAFHSAANLQGIEVAPMIRKKQVGPMALLPFQQFAALAASLCPVDRPLLPLRKFVTEPRYVNLPLRLTSDPIRSAPGQAGKG